MGLRRADNKTLVMNSGQCGTLLRGAIWRFLRTLLQALSNSSGNRSDFEADLTLISAWPFLMHYFLVPVQQTLQDGYREATSYEHISLRSAYLN